MGRRLIFVIVSRSYLKVMQALSLAVTAAATGAETHIYFTHGGILRLVRGREDAIYDDDDMADDVRRGLEKKSIPRISELLDTLSMLDAKIFACPSAMAFHNITKDDLNEAVTAVRSVSESIRSLLDSESATVIYV